MNESYRPIPKIVEGLKENYPKLSEFELLSIAVQMQRITTYMHIRTIGQHQKVINMKNILILKLLLLPLLAFSQWTQQNSGTSQFLNEVDFANELTGYIVGTGVVLKTVDGGENWNLLDVDSTLSYSSLEVIDNNTLWVGTHEGKLFYSNDGGMNWEENELTSTRIHDVYFYNNDLGFTSADNTIYRTSNGGLNWSPTNLTSEHIHTFSFEVFMVNDSVGYSSFEGLRKTIDGGITWQSIAFIIDMPDEANILQSIYFKDEQEGYIGSPYYHGLYYTDNGGENLQFRAISVEDLCFINDIGYMIGNSTYILKTTDFGQNWSEVYLGERVLTKAHFVDENIGWVVGWSGMILHTKTGGELIDNVEEIGGHINIETYPNPVTDVLNLKIPEELKNKILRLEILSPNGQMIQEVDVQKTKINASHLATGVYYLHFICNDKVKYTQSFIKQK